MARNYDAKNVSTSLSEVQAHLLYSSLDQYNHEQRKRKRPSLILAALLLLLLASTTGISVAIVLIVKASEIEEKASLPRDLIFFASVLSLLYICIHIRGARKDYERQRIGPPQKYGNYLHASALLVARLGIVTWVGALVATAITISKAAPYHEVSIFSLLICTSAIPPFLIISITIERNSTPFDTAGISKSSFLKYRVRDFEDDLAADASVSRRATILQRKPSESGSVLTLPTEEIFRLGAPNDEKPVHPEGNEQAVQPVAMADYLAMVSVPSIPAPQQTYCPGRWRADWDDGTSGARSTADSADAHAYSSTSYNTDASLPSSRLQPPSPTSSSSYDRRTLLSNLSSIRYVSGPGIAVCQPIKVVRNPAYVPKPDPSVGLERKPSNFSRPMRMRDSGVEVRVPGAYVEEANE
ncbi:hypothetical protein GGS21DRAFT_120266 [Xylaria nigripes]|nr:hypothetical protein GGS21DRAFT_120266 [Xylaria nigripes]